MQYRKGFIKFEHIGYGKVNVTNSGWHVCKFDLGANYASITQNEFNVVCMDFLNRPEFENLLRIGEVQS